MTLMGTPLVVVLAAAALLIPVVTITVWSRLRGPRVLRGGVRLLMLLLGQVTTVALVAVLVNNYGQFYTSWSDLFGTDHTPPVVSLYGAHGVDAPRTTHHGSTVALRVAAASIGVQTGRMQLEGRTDWSKRSQRTTRGEVESAIITGLRSRLTVPAYVYLPPQYFLPRFAHHRFPAVEVLSGYPGSAESLVDQLAYPSRALAMVRAHHSAPMIYVMLRSTAAPPRDTECTNIADGPQAETFLGGELISAVQHALRVRPGDWGVIGDSTGGYCAAKLAMAHPSVYAGGVSLSGYYHALDGGTAGNLFRGSLRLRHDNDLRWLLKHRPVPHVSLYVTSGLQQTSTQEGYPETMRFLHLVRAPMSVTAVIEKVGGHNFRTWERELPQAMRWMAARIMAPTARPHHNHHSHHHDRHRAIEAAQAIVRTPSA